MLKRICNITKKIAPFLNCQKKFAIFGAWSEKDRRLKFQENWQENFVWHIMSLIMWLTKEFTNSILKQKRLANFFGHTLGNIAHLLKMKFRKDNEEFMEKALGIYKMSFANVVLIENEDCSFFFATSNMFSIDHLPEIFLNERNVWPNEFTRSWQ